MTTKSKATEEGVRIAQARERGLNLIRWNGDHITGIPAMNLSPGAVADLNDKQVLACLATGLYQIAPAAVEEGESHE